MKTHKWIVLAALAAALAPAARATPFAKDVILLGGSETDLTYLPGNYTSMGWTGIDKDLNSGAGGDFIYLYVKWEESADVNLGYITGFYIKRGANDVTDTLTFDGRTYHLAPYTGGSHFRSQKGDLNSGTGDNSDSIHLYYTRDLFPDDRAVTNIWFNSHSTGAVGANGSTDGGYDLNKNAGGDYIYMHYATATASRTVDLSTLTKDFTALDGMILTGSLGTAVNLSIAAGATVTLDGATVPRWTAGWGDAPAAIACEGNATIVLVGTNRLEGKNGRSGISCPEGSTLVIKGNGSLAAEGGDGAAGIGSCSGGASGHVVIQGGTVTATGGSQAAGIGAGRNGRCGNVSVTGGTVSATGGSGSPGFGCGAGGQCGNVTIGGGTVTAVRGDSAPYSVGRAADGTCGTVKIGGVTTGPVVQSPIVYSSVDTTVYTAVFDKNDGSGTTFSVEFRADTPQTVPACPFSRAGAAFLAWNEAADGTGAFHDVGDYVIFRNTTIYAQWSLFDYTIGYDLAGGLPPDGTNNPASYTVESAFELVEPVRAGYDFAGWTWTGQSEPTNPVVVPLGSTGDRFYTANWTLATYAIAYDLAGGALPDGTNNPTSYTVESADIALAEPARPHFVFAGWTWPGQTSPMRSVVIPRGSTGDRSFAANWTPRTYEVAFENYDGTPLQSGTLAHPAAPVYEGETPVRPDAGDWSYDFAGWTDGESVYSGALPPVVQDVTYTAVFDPVPRRYFLHPPERGPMRAACFRLPEEGGSPVPAEKAPAGTAILVDIFPLPGMGVVSVSVTNALGESVPLETGRAGPVAFTMPAGDVWIAAEAAAAHRIDVVPNHCAAAVAVSSNGSTAEPGSAVCEAAAGALVTIAVRAAENVRIPSISVESKGVATEIATEPLGASGASVLVAAFTMPDAPVVVSFNAVDDALPALSAGTDEVEGGIVYAFVPETDGVYRFGCAAGSPIVLAFGDALGVPMKSAMLPEVGDSVALSLPAGRTVLVSCTYAGAGARLSVSRESDAALFAVSVDASTAFAATLRPEPDAAPAGHPIAVAAAAKPGFRVTGVVAEGESGAVCAAEPYGAPGCWIFAMPDEAVVVRPTFEPDPAMRIGENPVFFESDAKVYSFFAPEGGWYRFRGGPEGSEIRIADTNGVPLDAEWETGDDGVEYAVVYLEAFEECRIVAFSWAEPCLAAVGISRVRRHAIAKADSEGGGFMVLNGNNSLVDEAVEGTAVFLADFPDPGRGLVSWTVTDATGAAVKVDVDWGNDLWYFLMPATDVVVSATFAGLHAAVLAEDWRIGDFCETVADLGPAWDGGDVPAGVPVEVVCRPLLGWTIKSFDVVPETGGSIPCATVPRSWGLRYWSAAFTMPDADVVITPVFVPTNYPALSVGTNDVRTAVYSFVPPATGGYRFALDAGTEWRASLYPAFASFPGEELGEASSGSPDFEKTLSAGSTYYLAVEDLAESAVQADPGASPEPAPPAAPTVSIEKLWDIGAPLSVTVVQAEHGTLVASASEADSGTLVYFLADPDPGYVAQKPNVKDGNGYWNVVSEAGDGRRFYLYMPSADITATARFVPDRRLLLGENAVRFERNMQPFRFVPPASGWYRFRSTTGRETTPGLADWNSSAVDIRWTLTRDGDFDFLVRLQGGRSYELSVGYDDASVNASIVVETTSLLPFPDYLQDADDVVQDNYLAWAAKYGPDADGAHAAAFLLDIDPATAIPAGAALLKVTDFRVDGPVARFELGSDVADLVVQQSAGGDPGLETTCYVGNGVLVLSSGEDLSSTNEWTSVPLYVLPGENGRVVGEHFIAAVIEIGGGGGTGGGDIGVGIVGGGETGGSGVIGGVIGFGSLPTNGLYRPALSTRSPFEPGME